MGSLILSKDLIVHILSFLEPIDLSIIVTTNKRFAETVKERRLWKSVYTRKHGHDLSSSMWPKVHDELDDDYKCAFIFNLMRFKIFAFQTTDLLIIFEPLGTLCSHAKFLHISHSFLRNHRDIEIFKKFFAYIKVNCFTFIQWCDTVELICNLIKLDYTYIPGNNVVVNLERFCDHCNEQGAALPCGNYNNCNTFYCTEECLRLDRENHEFPCYLSSPTYD
jgi:hypothetical protein